jgi:hypothetical protein
MFLQELPISTVKVRKNPLPGNPTPAAPVSLRVEYNATKLDNRQQTPQAVYLTTTVPDGVFAALDAHFATNYVVDLPPYQLERVERRYGDEGNRAYLTSRTGQHIATVRWNREKQPNALVFSISRCLEGDGARIAKMVEQIAFISKGLQYFASCPLDLAAPLSNNVCGIAYGKKALVQLDTLYLKICEGDLPFIEFDEMGLHKVGEYFIHEQGTGGKMYARKAEVWHRGQHIANVLWDARQATLEGSAKYEIMNRVLYDTTLTREQLVDNPVKALRSVVFKAFRGDIAFDGEGFISFLEAVHAREIIAVRQRAYQKAKKYVSVATDEIEGFYFGSRSAGRFLRCYNKTRELEASKKQYIADHHEKNGLTGIIGRLELELKTDYIRTVEGFNWRDLFDREKLVSIAEQALVGWFDWVDADGTDNKLNRRQRVQIIDFSNVKKTKYARHFPEPVKSDRMERIMIKQLILRAENAGTDAATIEHLQTAATMAEDSRLWGWMTSNLARFDLLIKKRALLEEREVSHRFLAGGSEGALWDAYGRYIPFDAEHGELASTEPIIHYSTAA